MLEILKAKKELLEAKLLEEVVTNEDMAEIDEQVSEYREQLIAELKEEKEVNAEKINAQLEVVNELIQECESNETIQEEEETSEEVDEVSPSTTIPIL